jgi:pSer/pThr/pTyr-binding forkhead associated (FHA) protein
MQVPGKARLILIKGADEMDGISYHLNAESHLVGKSEGVILFANDPWVSPKHANFYYRDSALFVRDEDTDNGVFIRTRETISLSPGDCFSVGEQLFRFEAAVDAADQPDGDGTYFFHSPWENKSFRVVQLLEGGGEGMQVHDKEGEITIGRDDCDMNFYDDEFMSLKHVKIASVGQKHELEDLGSKNGTFLKLKGEQKLEHGDYVMIGKELLRVEIV